MGVREWWDDNEDDYIDDSTYGCILGVMIGLAIVSLFIVGIVMF
jgi:hypothetical protein